MKVKYVLFRNFVLVIFTTSTNTLFSIHSKTNNTINNAAVVGLIERIVPGKSDNFILETITAENNQEVFELESRNGKIVLRGSSSLALTRAFNP
ncbi:MAG: alpha-N-acetylglucosaminidase N-terminal domain-containing protein [Bacteroidales bacterium]|nr:alpha-N-acetylglucosaminidase N-terminal domain-containing protein [Bacteroidales bacterium]MDD3990331.1 alpha-N-acetylglucosaminidase N-terminal domain-containing protein [Bacteroidales bacterium]